MSPVPQHFYQVRDQRLWEDKTFICCRVSQEGNQDTNLSILTLASWPGSTVSQASSQLMHFEGPGSPYSFPWLGLCKSFLDWSMLQEKKALFAFFPFSGSSMVSSYPWSCPESFPQKGLNLGGWFLHSGSPPHATSDKDPLLDQIVIGLLWTLFSTNPCFLGFCVCL